MRCTCGYEHSYYSRELSDVKFISRYMGSNDYCVNGRRIGLGDDGTWKRDPTEDEKALVKTYRKEME